jgi:hypothetical protein
MVATKWSLSGKKNDLLTTKWFLGEEKKPIGGHQMVSHNP